MTFDEVTRNEDDEALPLEETAQILPDITRVNSLGSGLTLEQKASAPEKVFERYDINRAQEETRSTLANKLVDALIKTIYVIFLIHSINIVLLFISGQPEDEEKNKRVNFEASKDVAGLIFSPLVTLTATALGFYFGSGSGKDK